MIHVQTKVQTISSISTSEFALRTVYDQVVQAWVQLQGKYGGDARPPNMSVTDFSSIGGKKKEGRLPRSTVSLCWRPLGGVCPNGRFNRRLFLKRKSKELIWTI
jgi:hypothetical protein